MEEGYAGPRITAGRAAEQPARRHAHLEGLVLNNERLCVLFIIALYISNNLADSSEYRNVMRAICPLGRAMKYKRRTLDIVPTARGRCVRR
ncbi:hypothetical protein EMIT0158MI4_110038 [Burkholderia ambifaria]